MAYRLGYGGSAWINNGSSTVQVLVTAGSLSESVSPSYLNMIWTPPTSEMAGRVRHAEGTTAYDGSISFDLHDGSLALFLVSGGLLQRHFTFHVGISDGIYNWAMYNCKMRSLTISGSVGGLLSAQLNFVSISGRTGGVAGNFIRDSAVPYGYWYSGSSGAYIGYIKDWTFTMNQDTEFVYRNVANSPGSPESPDYIKVGSVSYSLGVSTYIDLGAANLNVIQIATTSFTLTGTTTSKDYTFGGVTDLSTYSHTFETSALGVSNTNVIS